MSGFQNGFDSKRLLYAGDYWICPYRRGIYDMNSANNKILGKGSFGHVYTADMTTAGGNTKKVVIKHQNGIGSNVYKQKLAYREIHIMRHLGRDAFSTPKKYSVSDIVEMKYPFAGASAAVSGEGSPVVVSTASAEECIWRPCTIQMVDEERNVATLLDSSDGQTYIEVPFACIRFARSPYILNLIDAFSPEGGVGVIDRGLCLTMDLMDSDLSKFLKQSTTVLSTDRIRYFMYQLMAGMKYFHSANVIHRDIKSANILIKGDHLKFADFGMSRVIDEELFKRSISGRVASKPILSSIVTKSVVSRWWRAPEVILFNSLRKPYDNKVDNWSMGCIFAELLHLQEENYNNAPICRNCGVSQLHEHDSVLFLSDKYKLSPDTIIAQWDAQRPYSLLPASYKIEPEDDPPHSFTLTAQDMVTLNAACDLLQRARCKSSATFGLSIHPVLCLKCIDNPAKSEYLYREDYEGGKRPIPNNCFRRAILQGDESSGGINFNSLNSTRPDQLLVNLLASGLPSDTTVDKIYEDTADTRELKLLRSRELLKKQDWSRVFPESCSDAIDLLDKLFAFDPDERISAQDALEHTFLKDCSRRNKTSEYTYQGTNLKEAAKQKRSEDSSSLLDSIAKDLRIYDIKFGTSDQSAPSLSESRSNFNSSAAGGEILF